MNNPFAPDGAMAVGEHFIGRTEIIQNINRQVFKTTPPTNMAFIGVNGIGTSSLVHTTILARKDVLIRKSLIPIEVSFAIYDRSSSFFQSLISQCKDTMEKLGWLSPEIQSAFDNASEALKPSDPWTPWLAIGNFFKQVKKNGYYTLFILDRFDKARSFKKDDKAFNFLRELASKPSDYGVRLVLTSRLSIETIQEKADSVSELPGIFTTGTHYLKMFSNKDLEDYFDRFSKIGIQISVEGKKQVLFYCGGHPYLLVILGRQIIDGFRHNKEQGIDVQEINVNDVNTAAYAVLEFINKYYVNLINLLKDVGLFNILLQILFNSSSGVGNADVHKLKNYDLIKPTEEGTYVAYSEHFGKYLEENSDNLWQPSSNDASDISCQDKRGTSIRIWDKTELALRKMITTTVSGQGNWIKTLEQTNQVCQSIVNRARRQQKKHGGKPGANVSQNLMDYTQQSDLRKIIVDTDLWCHFFKPVFSGDRRKWDILLAQVIETRAAIVHQTYELSFAEHQIFRGQCELILSQLSQHKSKNEDSNLLELDQHAEAKSVKIERAIHTYDVKNENENQDDQEELHQEADGPEVHQGIVTQLNKDLSYGFIQPITREGEKKELIRMHVNDFINKDDFEKLQINNRVEFNIISAGNSSKVANVVLVQDDKE